MTLPGFTADTSLSHSRRHYGTRRALPGSGPGMVVPAGECDVYHVASSECLDIAIDAFKAGNLKKSALYGELYESYETLASACESGPSL